MIEFDVLCAGHACFDLTFLAPRHPDPDEKMFVDGLVMCGGGPAANASVAAARLGCRSAFAGYLGNDVWGSLHAEELIREGVATDFVVRGNDPTPLAVVLAKPDGLRTVLNFKGNTKPLPAGSLDFSSLTAKVVLFDGYEPDLSPPLAKEARSRGIKTVLDSGSVHEGTRALIGLADYVVCSERFAREWTGLSDPASAADKLSDLAPSVVVTLGERGLVWKNADGAGRMPAFSVKAADTTGAGDAFHGAFAAGLASGLPWEDCLKFSSAAAALCCTRIGARTGLPTKERVDEFLKTAETSPVSGR
jgi:sulfofructose kinase